MLVGSGVVGTACTLPTEISMVVVSYADLPQPALRPPYVEQPGG